MPHVTSLHYDGRSNPVWHRVHGQYSRAPLHAPSDPVNVGAFSRRRRCSATRQPTAHVCARRVDLHLQLRLQSHGGHTAACKCKYRTSHVHLHLHLQLQLHTCTPVNESVQTGNAEMYRRSGLVTSREQGLRYDAALQCQRSCQEESWIRGVGCTCEPVLMCQRLHHVTSIIWLNCEPTASSRATH